MAPMPYALDNDVFFAALYEGHVAHIDARAWLDANKPMGWAIAMETYLAAMRLLMNPTILGRINSVRSCVAHCVIHLHDMGKKMHFTTAALESGRKGERE